MLMGVLAVTPMALAGGEAFVDLTFEQASAQAKQDNKLVLVDFYTTWCMPCKIMDNTTFVDEAVIKLLKEKTVAIKVDAERELKLAAKYRVNAYPTIMLIKPDGTEAARFVGMRSATQLVSDLAPVLKGVTPVSAKGSAQPSRDNDPSIRMKLGEALVKKGEYGKALNQYLWCFDHGLEHLPSFHGARLSLLLTSITRLGGKHPPAIKALEVRRDAAQKKILGTRKDLQSATDFVALNRVLKDQGRTLATYDRLSKDSPVRRLIFDGVSDLLLEARRYEDVLEMHGVEGRFAQKVAEYERTKRLPSGIDATLLEAALDSLRSNTCLVGCEDAEALAGTSRGDDARALIDWILAFDDSPKTRKLLGSHLERANNVEVLNYFELKSKAYQ